MLKSEVKLMSKFTINDLKTCMLVQFRDGDIHLVFTNIAEYDSLDGFTIFSTDGISWMHFNSNSYYEDLIHKSNRDLDIVKVWDGVSDDLNSFLRYGKQFCPDENRGKLIFNRGETFEISFDDAINKLRHYLEIDDDTEIKIIEN